MGGGTSEVLAILKGRCKMFPFFKSGAQKILPCFERVINDQSLIRNKHPIPLIRYNYTQTLKVVGAENTHSHVASDISFYDGEC